MDKYIVDFPTEQATFHCHCLIGKGLWQVVCQLDKKSVSCPKGKQNLNFFKPGVCITFVITLRKSCKRPECEKLPVREQYICKFQS